VLVANVLRQRKEADVAHLPMLYLHYLPTYLNNLIPPWTLKLPTIRAFVLMFHLLIAKPVIHR
jgi:hypothetical protein